MQVVARDGKVIFRFYSGKENKLLPSPGCEEWEVDITEAVRHLPRDHTALREAKRQAEETITKRIQEIENEARVLRELLKNP